VAKQRIINVIYKVDKKQIDASTTSVNKAKKATDDLTKSTKETGDQGVKSFTGLRDAIVATGLITLIGGLAKKIFDLGAAQQQTNIAFTTFLGSAEKAKKLIADLTKFSIITPFTPDQVFRSAKALLAFGVEADKIIPTLKQLGDVSAGTGKDLTEMAVIFDTSKRLISLVDNTAPCSYASLNIRAITPCRILIIDSFLINRDISS
jgi:hypothetical protein